MQVQAINSNNVKFGNLKGIESSKYFCNNLDKYVRAMDAVLNSDAIVGSLGSKYDFIAKLDNAENCYELSLLPVSKLGVSSNKKPSWVVRIIDFFHRKKENFNNDLTKKVRKLAGKEHSKLPNLPKTILVCSESGPSEAEAFRNFIKRVGTVSADFLESKVKDGNKGLNPLKRIIN